MALIDLDGLRRRTMFDVGRRWQPLVRLAASLLSYPTVTRTDYLRFLIAYLSHSKHRSGAWRVYFGKLGQKASAYLQRAQRRKTGKLDGLGP